MSSELATLKAELEKVKTEMSRPNRPAVEPTGALATGAPNAVVGGFARDSQPFRITKALVQHIYGTDRESSKYEGDVLTRFRKALIDTNSLPPGGSPGAWWLPMNFDALGERVNAHPDCKYAREVIESSGMAYDPEEAAWLVRKGFIRKTMSAYTDTLGGSLIAPPTQGSVIPLIRPEAAVLAAGAQTYPLPPTGRHVRPRITSAPNVQAVAESQDTPESDLGTDQMELTARKIAGAARISEESTTFTSGTIDTYVKAELDRSLGLKMDAYAFYGTGTSSIPAGLTSAAYSAAVINVATTYSTAAGVGTNGNTLRPEYGDLLPALIGERSFNMDSASGCWVMRPTAYASALGVRADATVPGDASGPLVDILRRFSEGAPNQFRGRKVVQTTNVKGDKTKGTGTNLSDVFYGLWNHCVVATYGAVQFKEGHDGNSFLRGQYLMRATMYGDIGFEYPSAFLYLPDVIGSAGLL